MLILKSYKLRLYPNKGQQVFFNKTFGACRVIYNEMLYNLQENYKNGIKKDKYKLFKDIKSKYEWMKEVDSNALCSTFRDLDTAYARFFNNKSKFPKFKHKKEKNTYRNNNVLNRKIQNLIKNDKIKIPKIGYIKFKQNYSFNDIKKVRNITILKSKTNKYYCSLCVEIEQKEYFHTGNIIGLDLGIKNLVIDSNGIKYKNLKPYTKLENKIKHLNKLYSKKKKGSKNQEKARLKLAIAYEKLSNKRKDNLHKITTKLIKENDVICIENLNVKGIIKNHKLAKSIQDCSFGTLVSMLKYKAQWHNRKIIEIGRFYPSSKLCSNCGHKMSNMGLEIRQWICPICGVQHDRDINAAINIKNEGLRILDTIGIEQTEFKPLENTTMDDKLAITLKSSDSMN